MHRSGGRNLARLNVRLLFIEDNILGTDKMSRFADTITDAALEAILDGLATR